MEILVGMTLLLQLFMSIQIMRMRKKVLQKIKELSEELGEIKVLNCKNSKKEEEKTAAENKNIEIGQVEKEAEDKNIQKSAQEALINEVLSEVFS